MLKGVAVLKGLTATQKTVEGEYRNTKQGKASQYWSNTKDSGGGEIQKYKANKCVPALKQHKNTVEKEYRNTKQRDKKGLKKQHKNRVREEYRNIKQD